MATGTDITAVLNLQFIGVPTVASGQAVQSGNVAALVPSFAALLGAGSPAVPGEPAAPPAEPLAQPQPATSAVGIPSQEPLAVAPVPTAIPAAVAVAIVGDQASAEPVPAAWAAEPAVESPADPAAVAPAWTAQAARPEAAGAVRVGDEGEEDEAPPAASPVEPIAPADSMFTALIATLVFAVPVLPTAPSGPDGSSLPMSVAGPSPVTSVPLGIADAHPAAADVVVGAHPAAAAARPVTPRASHSAPTTSPVPVRGAAGVPPSAVPGIAASPFGGVPDSTGMDALPLSDAPDDGVEALLPASGSSSEDGQSLIHATRQVQLRASVAPPLAAASQPASPVPPRAAQNVPVLPTTAPVSPAEQRWDAEAAVPPPVAGTVPSSSPAGLPTPVVAGDPLPSPTEAVATEPRAGERPSVRGVSRLAEAPQVAAEDLMLPEDPELPGTAPEFRPAQSSAVHPSLTMAERPEPPITASAAMTVVSRSVAAAPVASDVPEASAVAVPAPVAAARLRRPHADQVRASDVAVAPAVPDSIAIPLPAAGRHQAPRAAPADDAVAAPVAWHPAPAPDEAAPPLPGTVPLPAPSEEARLRQPELAVQAAGAPAGHADAPALMAQQPAAVPAPAVRTESAQPPLPTANPVERMVVRQVSRALVRSTPTGDRSLVIRLTPPELGTVRIEFIERDGAVTARIHADDPAVRQALDRLLPQVRGELRAADSPVQQITVSAGSSSDQAFDGRGFDGRGAQQHQQRQESAGAGTRGRRGDRPVFSLDGGPAPIEASAPSAPRTRIPDTIVDALA